MKLTHNHFRTPYEQCTCQVFGVDRHGNLVWEQCFRCSVMEVMRRRHRRIEFCLLVALALVAFGSIFFRIGFDKGWW